MTRGGTSDSSPSKRFLEYFLFLLIGPTIVGEKAFATLSVCNSTATSLSVAVGVREAEGVLLAGWIHVPQLRCRVVIRQSVQGSYLAVFARNLRGEVWSGTEGFCVDGSDFMVRSVDCRANRFPPAAFTRVDTRKNNVTVTFAAEGDVVVQSSSLPVGRDDDLQDALDLVSAAINTTLRAHAGLMDGRVIVGNGMRIQFHARVEQPKLLKMQDWIEIDLPVLFQLEASRRIAGKNVVFGSCGMQDPRIVKLSFITRLLPSGARTTLTKSEFVKRCRLPVIGDISERLQDTLGPELELLVMTLDAKINDALLIAQRSPGDSEGLSQGAKGSNR